MEELFMRSRKHVQPIYDRNDVDRKVKINSMTQQEIKVEHITNDHSEDELMLHPKSDKISKNQSKSIQLLSSGIEKALQVVKLENDFTFVFNDLFYICPKFLACFLSPKLCEQLKLDPTIDTFKLKYYPVNKFKKYFLHQEEETANKLNEFTSEQEESKEQDENSKEKLDKKCDGDLLNEVFYKMICLMKGKEIEIKQNSEEKELLMNIALEIGNSELISKLNKEGEEMKTTNVIERLNLLSQSHISIEEEIEFIAAHFTEMEKEKYSKLSVEILESILSHPKFVIKSENWLYDLIFSLGKNYEILLSYIEFEYLSDSKMKHFIEHFKFENLNVSIWKHLCQRLKLHIDPHLHYTRHLGEYYSFDSSSPFNGIFNHLNKECQGNCINKEIVHTYNYLGQKNYDTIVNYSSNNSCTVGHPNSRDITGWLKFDFRQKAVTLDYYTIKSSDGNNGYLYQWMIEGSNDDKSWDKLDERNTRDLSSSYVFHSYSCLSTKSYRYIRISKTDAGAISLSNIELFGHLSNSVEE
ncbi:hypothetical protein TRFO_09241 [Tritrichomonas foetus]|uniref:F5/8 type C domain-containing protein n=1 Tax=Tritrichomonas foetus TaxID=1144522 RepID=A0A1J4JFC5_9EUKA|nr:hypothetical protein TRFO_09241 [Tritrichomonas foetus]|eukprot:OHS97816.1 hypothetical protein TRFO_09241 [Tritrichomonas foetus]